MKCGIFVIKINGIHNDAAVSYPPTTTAYPPASYVTAPPLPMGYPSKDGPVAYPQQSDPEQTTSRGDGFWKGW